MDISPLATVWREFLAGEVVSTQGEAVLMSRGAGQMQSTQGGLYHASAASTTPLDQLIKAAAPHPVTELSSGDVALAAPRVIAMYPKQEQIWERRPPVGPRVECK